jgi:hypothetical protein
MAQQNSTSEIILDSSVIYNYPSVLACAHNGSTLVIPEQVRQKIADLIDDKLIAKSIEDLLAESQRVPPGGHQTFLRIEPRRAHDGLDKNTAIVRLAETMAINNTNVTVLTDNRKLRRRLTDLQIGIRTPAVTDFIAAMDQSSQDPRFDDILKRIKQENRKLVFYGSIVPAALAFSLALLAALFMSSPSMPSTLQEISVPFVRIAGVLLFLTIGVGMYLFRSRYRAAYALLEIFAGTTLAFVVLFSYSPPTDITDTVLKMLGGLYVIVRGLDNMAKAAPRSSWRGIWWRTMPDD